MSNRFMHLAAPGVWQLTPYLPGKPVEELERELGIINSIKLASNENPLGPSPRAIEAIERHAAGLHYYPDGAAYRLSERLSREHGVEASCFTFGNGSNDVLELVARAFLTPDHSAVYSQYAFAVYPIVVQAIGASANVARAYPQDHADMPLGHDPDAIVEAVDESTRIVFVANPNNPTGTWLSPDAVEQLLERMPGHVITVLDMAYIEYMPEAMKPDIPALLARFTNLVVTCTFSKVYALAGLRIGYAMSHPDIADLLNRVRQPFNTNLLAQAAAVAALDDAAHIARSVEMNARGRDFMQTSLSAMGLRALPTMGNFITVNVGRTAQPVYHALLRQGVIVRPVANYAMPDYLRITIGTDEQSERCLQALDTVLNSLDGEAP